MKKKKKEKEKYTLGELFCGPGGLALGAENTGKFKHKWAIDIDPDTIETFKSNHKNCKTHTMDARKIDEEFVKKLSTVDGFIFGFPCNDFSIAGKKKGLKGEYGPLYKRACFFLKNLRKKPKFFLAENVSNIAIPTLNKKSGRSDLQLTEEEKNRDNYTNFRKIMIDLAACGYTIYADTLNFEKLEVPQTRRRMILFGILEKYYKKTNYEKLSFSFSEITSKHALDQLYKFAKNNKVYNHELPNHSDEIIKRLKKTKPGQNVWDIGGLPDVKSARMSNIYKKLDPNKPAYTVTGSGGGGTHMYHYKDPRALTNRERATLQTFPFKYKFSGTKESIRKQIGMAVPVNAAKYLMKNVYKALQSRQNNKSVHDWFIRANTKKLYIKSFDEIEDFDQEEMKF